ncbi:MAG: 1-(5-phosphoribosyl)-5-[(5-phosphoribosylamino)methylideneamino]imidazole-4-carboxamide isomerase [Planctomycetes bacterium]|nr:1-(5-phosphoribosyl)-5-[(5-phosphoribosylamino)methylideneamino]imidazole-4-carboxamide isomerase [Planctomycetota bacterium]
MHIIPAVDIRDGKAVRLFQGDKNRETVYSDSPADMARRWADQGATYLHVVDLDGAFDGDSANEPHIQAIVRAVTIPVEVGGGVRSLDKARRLVDLGVDRVIVGTRALEAPEFVQQLTAALPGRINVGVDARDGLVAIKGWTETSGVRAEEFLASFSGSAVGAIIYTDISRDGALAGVNVPAMRSACQATDIPIIASGGVTSVEDIRALRDLPLFGIITGKALYDGRLTLAEAMAALGDGDASDHRPRPPTAAKERS